MILNISHKKTLKYDYDSKFNSSIFVKSFKFLENKNELCKVRNWIWQSVDQIRELDSVEYDIWLVCSISTVSNFSLKVQICFSPYNIK